MTAASPARDRAGHQGNRSGRHGPGNPDRLPAVIAHLIAICRARRDRGVTADVQTAVPGRYVVTVCRHQTELALTFAWRHRRWDLADVELTEDGEPQDAARSIYEVIRLLSDHEIGTGTPSRTRAVQAPRNSALETKKNTVLRI